jgi:hypothetical protein
MFVTASPIFNVVNDVQPSNTGALALPIVVQFTALKLKRERLLHPPKAELPIYETESPIVNDSNPLQLENVSGPIHITELGTITDVKAGQLAKAFPPIVLTESPINNALTLLQPLNAEPSIVITDSGISTDDKPTQLANARLPIFITELPITKYTRLLQLKKAEVPIVVTEFGIIRVSFKPLQSLNADDGIFVTLSPIFNV